MTTDFRGTPLFPAIKFQEAERGDRVLRLQMDTLVRTRNRYGVWYLSLVHSEHYIDLSVHVTPLARNYQVSQALSKFLQDAYSAIQLGRADERIVNHLNEPVYVRDPKGDMSEEERMRLMLSNGPTKVKLPVPPRKYDRTGLVIAIFMAAVGIAMLTLGLAMRFYSVMDMITAVLGGGLTGAGVALTGISWIILRLSRNR